ncbi:HDOD domain-containing protein [Leptospira santarosai]|uniref:HDIG domain protein n=5 Tax=Leptospira santarosai TaxID=28183 RepID=M6UQF0_9LEPT|nr:HDOD domain-containing protein [Leptospira santarosai]EMO59888.1 HDIG domain protein [Leptospira santarosai str. CBC1416]EKO34130.1 HDIG domain protein [Leptospira santarosai str. MOR084]EKS10084.1 HDIG domain protein [Leptospira santarosai str. JET]EKT87451.1 HD family phosphohydrolase [Leptospira santarosai serovar Shermani str. LT 821]EMF92394.1 HDIG domain protein [Leptospira santarosai str. ST188]
MKEKIDQLFLNDAQLPRISSVVTKVMQMVQKEDVAIPDLAKEISHDPGLTADVIKLSNSAYYRAAKPIKTVQESLMTLGIKTVKDIILLTAARGILKKDLKGYQVEAEDNWIHSLTVAELSKRICEQKKLKIDLDLAFTGGLLHNIGKVILADFFPAAIANLREELKNHSVSFEELERKHFGYSHEEASEKLLEKWNFPKELVHVARNYSRPENEKEFQELVSVVHVSHSIAITAGVGIDIAGLSAPISNEALQILEITDSDLQMYYTVLPEIQKHIRELIQA